MAAAAANEIVILSMDDDEDNAAAVDDDNTAAAAAAAAEELQFTKQRRHRRASAAAAAAASATNFENEQQRLQQSKRPPPPSSAQSSSDWTVKTRGTAIAWMQRAVTMKYLHLTTSQYYDKLSKWLTVPVVFLTAGIGTGLVALAAGTQGDGNGAGGAETSSAAGSIVATVFTWLLAVTSFVTAGLSTVNMQLDPSGLSEKHLHKSVFWSTTADDLALELSIIDDDVQYGRSGDVSAAASAVWFLPHVQKNMSMAENLPPVLPEWVYNLKQTEIMHGELTKELISLDKRFQNLLHFHRKDDDDNGDGNGTVEQQKELPSEEDQVYRKKYEQQQQPAPPVFGAVDNDDTLSVATLKRQLSNFHQNFRNQIRMQRQEYGMNILFGDGANRIHRNAAAAAAKETAEEQKGQQQQHHDIV